MGLCGSCGKPGWAGTKEVGGPAEGLYRYNDAVPFAIRDFKPEEELNVTDQVNKLIIEATKLENLCQHYIGWCSFW